ncbi:ATP-binding cassette domain-containing protein [Tsukamurella pseudospumae]|uniref:ATP-binding cassette domain-containing protein n=1 Tax=Tsukamurella pseudospumae TaxID=239498 RepID=UPI002F90A76D
MSTALELRSLTKTYPAADGGVMTAVDTLDLTIESGEVVAFLGPNGAGKSTTIDMILGLIPPDTGAVTVFGGTPGDAVAQGRVAAVQQSGGLLPTLTVQDTVDLVAACTPGPTPMRPSPARVSTPFAHGRSGSAPEASSRPCGSPSRCSRSRTC